MKCQDTGQSTSPGRSVLNSQEVPGLSYLSFLYKAFILFFFLLNKWDVKGMQAFPCWISIDNSVKDDRGEIEIAYLK